MSKNELVVKDNTIINASYYLGLVEQRIMLLAIAKSRSLGVPITESDYLCIHAKEYLDTFKSNETSIYQSLKNSCDTLFNRQFTYKTEDTKGRSVIVKSHWVQSAKYIESSGEICILFAKELIPFITELEKRFTSYKLSDISPLTSVYAIRLYELLISWKSAHKTPIFELLDFRNKLGVSETEYSRMSDFKRRVLDVAVSQINKHTNIYIQYEQHKKGRIIIGFSFSFVEKQVDRDPNTIDWVDEDKKPTRKKITKQQAAAMGRPGEEWPELLARIGKDYHVIGI